MSENISIILAFTAGLLSFASPCVLPLIPSYLCVIGGIQMGGLPANPTRRSTDMLSGKSAGFKPWLLIKTLFFVLGFSAVFITLSIVLAASISMMSSALRWIGWISGSLVIILGLHIIFDFLPFLRYEKRFLLKPHTMPDEAPQSRASRGTRIALQGAAGAFVAGAAFGAGWTPCVGPVLAGILLLAAQSGGIARAVVYLAFFSAGLGLPFVLASAFFDLFRKAKSAMQKHLPLIQKISGALLIVMGILMISGHYRVFSGLAAKWQESLTKSTSVEKPAQAAVQDNVISQPVLDAFRKARLPVVSKAVAPINFTAPLPDGNTVTLSDLKGKAVFLNFWASWCGPCRAEMPSMEALYQQLKERGFEILAVNIQEDRSIVLSFMAENALTFNTVLDTNGRISSQYGVQSIPTTYIIDKRGLIVSRLVGSIDWHTESIIAALESLL